MNKTPPIILVPASKLSIAPTNVRKRSDPEADADDDDAGNAPAAGSATSPLAYSDSTTEEDDVPKPATSDELPPLPPSNVKMVPSRHKTAPPQSRRPEPASVTPKRAPLRR